MTARVRRAALGLGLLLLPCVLPAQGLPQRADEPPPVPRGGILVSISPVAYGTLTGDGLTGASSENGMGFGFSVGFGLTERFFLLADVTRTDLVIEAGSSYGLWQIDPLLRLTPFPWRVGRLAIAPFVDIGGGLTKAVGERPTLGGVENMTYSGSAITAGAGLNVFVQRRWAITAGVHGSIGMITDVKRGNVTQSNLRINERTTRANLGVNWYPTLGR